MENPSVRAVDDAQAALHVVSVVRSRRDADEWGAHGADLANSGVLSA